jgi:hypothetical protein
MSAGCQDGQDEARDTVIVDIAPSDTTGYATAAAGVTGIYHSVYQVGPGRLLGFLLDALGIGSDITCWDQAP